MGESDDCFLLVSTGFCWCEDGCKGRKTVLIALAPQCKSIAGENETLKNNIIIKDPKYNHRLHL